MLAETLVTQHSPCYSAVSASLMNPLPDCSIYSLFCYTHYLILWISTSLLQRFTSESSRELMSSEEYCSDLRKLNSEQRQVVMFLLLLIKLPSQLPLSLSLFSISSLALSSLCSLSQFSLFSLSSFPLSTISSSSDHLSSYDKEFKFRSVSLISEMPLVRGLSALLSHCQIEVNHLPL